MLAPLVVCLALVRLYSWYKMDAAPIPPGVLIGYEDYSDAASEAEVVDLIRARVGDRILVLFNGERLILEAEEIGLQIDTQRILQETAQYLEGDVFVRLVLRQVLGLPPEIHHVPVYYAIDFERARVWLHAINERYRTKSQPYRLLPVDRDWLAGQGDGDGSSPSVDLAFMPYAYPDWTWKEGPRGMQVDVETSLTTLAEAFLGPGDRVWTLATVEDPPLAPELGSLAEVLDNFTASFHGFASFWMQDLTTGEVVEVDSQVAFSGMSTLKLLVVMAVMEAIDGIASAPDLGQWIDLGLVDSNNSAANLLMQYLGDGSVVAGAAVVTDFARSLGLENSFFLTGYDDPARVVPLVTPANQSVW
ncbi:MAG: serine hydrolase, partial [Caldilineaceae bacterium SB0666_bin_21]|nr:serine hydrolase [Caldilineaceae bacterium SB0666_bin_21]